MPKVIHIIDSLGRGGTQTQLVLLVSGLAKLGWEQKVWCLNDVCDAGLQEQLAAHAEVTVIGKLQMVTGIAVVRFLRLSRSWKPDIIQTLLPVSDIFGRVLGRMHGRCSIVTSIRSVNSQKNASQFWLDQITMRWAARVIFNSRRIVEFSCAHEGVVAEQVVVIPNSVDGTLFRRPPISRQDLDVPEAVVLLGAVGRLDARKGYSYLLTAYGEILAEGSRRIHLLIVGNGPSRADLVVQAERLGIRDHVSFLGARTDIPPILKACDLFVHPSLQEGSPNAVLEAMAAGCPVVATDVGGTSELLEHHKCAALVPPADVSALKSAIERQLQEVTTWQADRDAWSEEIQRLYSVDVMACAYDSVYRSLLSPPEKKLPR